MSKCFYFLTNSLVFVIAVVLMISGVLHQMDPSKFAFDLINLSLDRRVRFVIVVIPVLEIVLGGLILFDICKPTAIRWTGVYFCCFRW